MDEFAPPVLVPLPLRVSIADAIRRGIVLGELVPGQRLDEKSLAGKFGVSRIPIREALALLERDGLVSSEPRRGTYVVGLSDEDIHDIYDFRRMLETYAVRRVAASVDTAGLAELRALVERTETAMHANQAQRMADYDLEFHRKLVALAGNKRALNAWEMIADLVAVFLSINSSMFREVPKTEQPIDEHRHSKLLRLIAAHDVDGAEALLREHLQASEMVIRASIKRFTAQLQAARETRRDGHGQP
ncbi:MAG: GntR family transcriptional regulator [Anaerolineales bacterium]|nr:GntR family transcriptional regulator [Anaerolineales bacterium]